MAVHITIYPEQAAADALRAFMAVNNCSATAAVELLLARYAQERSALVTAGTALPRVSRLQAA